MTCAPARQALGGPQSDAGPLRADLRLISRIRADEILAEIPTEVHGALQPDPTPAAGASALCCLTPLAVAPPPAAESEAAGAAGGPAAAGSLAAFALGSRPHAAAPLVLVGAPHGAPPPAPPASPGGGPLPARRAREETLLRAFELLDSDRSGGLGLRELLAFFRTLGLTPSQVDPLPACLGLPNVQACPGLPTRGPRAPIAQTCHIPVAQQQVALHRHSATTRTRTVVAACHV